MVDSVKTVVYSASYDRYTNDDVIHYHEDIAMEAKIAAKKGKLTEYRRTMCQNDLYYLAVYELDMKFMYFVERKDDDGNLKEVVFRPWLFNRCREVQNSPDWHVDIWARDHFKSTIITVLKTIQDILVNPEITVCIYSYNADTARSFVSTIRQNLEKSTMRELFPDIIPENTKSGRYKDVSDDGTVEEKRFKWSDEEFTVKRKNRKKESTVQGYGLINQQPTGYHFDLLIYDDVVTPASVLTEAQNNKTYELWKMSLNTGSGDTYKVRIIGTYYSLRDTYFSILNPNYENGVTGGSKYTLRKYPCMNDGRPVLYSEEFIEMKRMTMIGFVFASQMMCDPQESSKFRFLLEWIPGFVEQSMIEEKKDDYNFYVIVDPANTKKKESDNTAMVVIATSADRKYYVPDIICTKLNPSERRDTLFSLIRRWTNSKRKPVVFYEMNSMSSDITMINEKMKSDSFYFEIHAASTKPRIRQDSRMTGEPVKASRIMALEPLFRQGRIVFMNTTWNKSWMGSVENTTALFINNEYVNWPFLKHDDVLDALSRIADLDTGVMISFPDSDKETNKRRLMNIKAKKSYRFDIPENGYVPY